MSKKAWHYSSWSDDEIRKEIGKYKALVFAYMNTDDKVPYWVSKSLKGFEDELKKRGVQ